MPGGISADSIVPLQTNAIMAGESVTPLAIGDLMSGFKSGFITVDDLQRRASEEVTRNDQQRTDLQANEIKRRLAPGDAANQEAMQGLTADKISLAKELQPGQRSLAVGDLEAKLQDQEWNRKFNSMDPLEQQEALNHKLTKDFAAVTGHVAPPEIFVAGSDQKPKDTADVWIEKTYGKMLDQAAENFEEGAPQSNEKEDFVSEGVERWDASRLPDFPAARGARGNEGSFFIGTPEDNVQRAQEERRLGAEFDAVQERRKKFREDQFKQLLGKQSIQTEFQKYLKQKDGETFKEGTAEYYEALSKELDLIKQTKGIEAGKMQAVPGVVLAREQAAGRVSGDALKSSEAQAESLRKDIADDKNLITFHKTEDSYNNIEALKAENIGRVPKNADDIALLYNFIKTMDPNAVREGEIGLVRSANPTLVMWVNKVNGLIQAKNTILGKEARADLFNTIDTQRAARDATIRPTVQIYAERARLANKPISQYLVTPLLNILATGSSKPKPAARAATPGVAPSAPGYVPPPGDDPSPERIQRKTIGGKIYDIHYEWDGKGDWKIKNKVESPLSGSARRG